MTMPNSKVTIPIRGVTGANGATHIMGYVDRMGYDFVSIDIYLTTTNNATNNPSTFKLGDCADTNLTSAADITACVGDGTGGWTIPDFNTATTTNNIVKMNVDCRGLERYLHIEVVPLTTMTCWAFANLFRAKESPDTSTEAGVIALVNG